MRNISPASLAMIAQTQGIEPINVLEIEWAAYDTQPVQRLMGIYSDKKHPEFGIEGRILDLANLENVINFTGGSSSQNLKVVLDDSDGQLKNIFNNVDIHKRPVWVKQWFNGLPYSEAFIIFEGQLSSPIVWNEGERTLSFDVVSKIEDIEIGYSPEEGSFNYIPPWLVGKMWPLVFGTVFDLPPLQLDKIPSGNLAGPLGMANCYAKQNTELLAKASLAIFLGVEWLMAALLAYNTAEHYGFEMFGSGVDNTELINQYNSLGDQWVDRGNQFLLEGQRIRLDNAKQLQACLEAAQAATLAAEQKIIGGAQFQQHQLIHVTVNGGQFTGSMNEDHFIIQSGTSPQTSGVRPPILAPLVVDDRAVVIEYAQDQAGLDQDFFFAFGGTPAFVTSFQPRYIVAGVIPVDVLYIRAWQTGIDPGGPNLTLRQLTVVPSEFYSVSQVNFGGINATVITLTQPLSTLGLTQPSNINLQGWEDDLFVTVRSPVGPNVVDILIWLIQHYTSHDYDKASFNLCRTQLAAYPANFAFMSRKNVVQALEEIAYQSRCAIYLKSGIFFLKYLSIQETPVDTISESDIIRQTLEVTTVDTESLFTRVTARWYDALSESEPNLVVLRSNILKYGLHDKTVDYYIYNNEQEVVKSATFWMIRDSNSFKLLKIKVPLTKLALETWDTVLLNFSHPFIANGPIIGVIQNCQYDSKDNTIDLQLWIPVRLGEMTQFPYALPAGSTIDIIWPNSDTPQIGAGNVLGGTARQTQGTQLNFPAQSPRYYSNNQSDKNDTAPIIDTAVDTTQINLGTKPSLSPLQGIFRSYKFKDFKDNPVILKPGTYPGKVTATTSDYNIYRVDVYYNGLNDNPRSSTVRQLDQDKNDSVAIGTWVVVTKAVVKDFSNVDGLANTQPTSAFELTMQAPIWS